MYKNIYFIVIIQLFLFPTSSSSVRFGHEVGSSSMDSTHYDRRVAHQQCSSNSETKQFHRASFWAAIRSSSALTTNSSNQTTLIPFRRHLIINNGEDRLVTRASSNKTNVSNTTISLGIDQATVDFIVDNQISGNLTVYVQVIECLDCPYEVIAQDLSS
ncbi:unnamed protein product, partial [Rotaria magnacalcarata]